MTGLITPTILFVRKTCLITDDEVRAYVAAEQIQLDRDFKAAWGSSARLLFDEAAPDDAWECWLEDHSPDPDALGFHDVTAAGEPILHVYVGDDMKYGLQWTITASHEVLETLADPWIDNTVSVTRNGETVQYARECADAPEDEAYAYDINGVLLSAFVTPAWFDPDATEGPFTYPVIPEIDSPFALAPGGYIGRRVMLPVPGDWDQLMAQGAPSRRQQKGHWSRTKRRFRKAT